MIQNVEGVPVLNLNGEEIKKSQASGMCFYALEQKLNFLLSTDRKLLSLLCDYSYKNLSSTKTSGYLLPTYLPASFHDSATLFKIIPI